MEIKIFQINQERDKNRLRFLGLEKTRQQQGSSKIDSGIYDEVFSGEVKCKNLDDVFAMFNTNIPPEHRGASLSTSDVVQVTKGSQSTKKGTYFCDIAGFSKVDFGQTEDMKITEKETETMTIQTKINRTFENGNLKALASANIGGAFAVHGIKVMSGKNGDFVVMPSQKGADDRYYDTFHPISADAREQLNDSVLQAYAQKMEEQAAGEQSEEAKDFAEPQQDEGQAFST